MWQYKTSLAWQAGKKAEARVEGKPPLAVATPPEFGGPPNTWSPEDLLTSAVESCLLTTTLFHLERAGVTLKTYSSEAVGTLDKTSNGLAFTGVSVDIKATVATAEDKATATKAITRAESTCLISQSVSFPVELRVQVTVAEDA
jgi:organic hydroperoxide reductase OsmC/OhrA